MADFGKAALYQLYKCFIPTSMLYIEDQSKQLIHIISQAGRYIFLKAMNPLKSDWPIVYFSYDSVKHSKPTDFSSLQQRKFVFMLQHLKSQQVCVFKSNLFGYLHFVGFIPTLRGCCARCWQLVIMG